MPRSSLSFRNLRFVFEMLQNRFITHRPIFLSHMITAACDCKCAICEYWKLGKKDEMTTEQVCQMLDDAREIGMTDYVIWGGEPLLRKDLPEIVAYANDLRLDSTIITNGSKLAERIDELAEYLYGLIVSIDYPEPNVHDQLRGRLGIFLKAMEGIERAKEYPHLNIFINCVVNKKNADKLEDMAKLAQKTGVKISFETMELIKSYNEPLALSESEIIDVALWLLQLKAKGYPIANSTAYFQALAGRCKYSCHVPKVLVTVQWNGRIRVCSNIVEEAKSMLSDCELGNIKQNSFREIFQSRNYVEYIRRAEECWKCDLSYPREISLIYSFDREAIANFITKITQ